VNAESVDPIIVVMAEMSLEAVASDHDRVIAWRRERSRARSMASALLLARVAAPAREPRRSPFSSPPFNASHELVRDLCDSLTRERHLVAVPAEPASMR
jgi:hypothetical protein